MYLKSILILLAFFFGWTASFSVHAQRTGLNQARTLSVQSNDSLINNSISGNQKEFESSKYSSPFDAVKGKKEDQSKRDAFSKHYINEDGSFTALIGAGPIHYEKNGRFYDIDHTIIPSNDANFPYVNATNLFSSYFGATAHTGVKNKTAEGEIQELLNTKMYWEVNGQIVNEVQSSDVPVSIEGDKAYYHHLFGNIAAELIVLTGKRKLNYIIPSAQDLGNVPENAEYLVFTEDVVLPFGWTSSRTEMGIMIKDAMGQEIYLYENPHSTDAESHALREENTIFETLQIGNTLTIKTKVKTEWLLSNERVFPVMVDPTTNVYPNNATNWTRSVASDGYDYGSSLYFGAYQGYWTRSFVKFNVSSITSQSNNLIVNSATGYINIIGAWGSWSRPWQFANSADPTTYQGTNLYYSANLGLSQIGSFNSYGWKSSAFYVPGGVESLANSLNNGHLNLSVTHAGSYYNNEYYQMAGHTSSDRPYLVINWEPISTDRTLTVSEAYTGASHANGNHTFTDGNLVTATSGTRPGYTIVGWTGTGSVPATGTGGTASFTITENSSITWIWEQIGTPNNIVFHNYGGTDQLTFNNSRIETNTPIFRMSHSAYDATDYEVEINTSPVFGGTSWTQIFTGTYPLNTESNFTFNNGFTPTSGTTYYVRARVRGAANVWSDYTTETYSFTYQTPKPTPDWFQTTQTQFQTDELSGVVANGSHDVVLQTGGGGNLVVNGDFSNGTTGWTITGANGAGKVVAIYSNLHTGFSGNWLGIGSGSTVFQPASGTIVVSQQIDLTNVSQITFNGGAYNYVSCCSDPSPNTKAEFKIGGTLTDTQGTIEATLNQNTNPTRQDKTVDVSGYSGVHVIKFVMTYNSNWNGNGVTRFYFADVKANAAAPSQGTITSTPIHLASVQGASSYTGIIWNQTLSGGNLTLKVQGSNDGTNFTDITGYTAISQTGDGEKTHDISGISPVPPHIRLFGTLNGANATLHDWAILFDEDTSLPVELTHFSTSCETGETSIHWTTASETNSDYFAVEKSRDGINWVVVGEKAAAGTSTAEVAYRFIDKNSTSGISYYRLRQVDFDGAAEIFGPISSTCVGNESSMTVYPNPNKGWFTVQITSSKKQSNVVLNLIDVTGKSIVTKQLDVSEGTTQFNIDDLNLSNGIYFVKVQGEGMQLEPVKVIVNK